MTDGDGDPGASAGSDPDARANGGVGTGGADPAGEPERSAAGDRLTALASGTRFGKFVSVGVVGALCDVAVLVTLHELVGVREEVAVLAGIETAILVMFAVNDRWTFAADGAAGLRPLLRRLGRSHVMRAAGSTTQFLVFLAVFHGVDLTLTVAGGERWYLVAKAAGVGVGMLVNYVFESLFTWKIHE